MAIVPGIWKVVGREPEALALSVSFPVGSHTVRAGSRELADAGLAEVPADGDADFALRRDAGTFKFRGSFRRGALGDASFGADLDFATSMRRIGFKLSDAEVLHCAALGLSADAAREFKADFPKISLESLLSGAAFGATPSYARTMRSLLRVSSFDEIVPLAVYGVTIDFARAMTGLLEAPLSARDLASLRMAEVDTNYVTGLVPALDSKPDARQVYRLKRLGVTPEAAREFAARERRRISCDELSLSAAAPATA
jgi:hypothetical protein